ncbi:putative metalloprotease CJM1_0395 family protein [Thiorhodococcus minor]|uniref:SprA-related family protein n=1 Tax=Thiorhodococcus minor TaxID=57489 RepID=A0A6M0JSH2_9GAMM|nr:putative metalloprotease CJM1_0395 family protein [Thiorhodococcus minor]NEV60476.1 hypothetical protein [Thiorhodococcus minor]
MQIHSTISSAPYPPMRADGAQGRVGASVAEEPSEGAALDPASAPAGEDGEQEDSKRVGSASASESASTEQELSQDEQREVELLKQRDAEVRAHEQAHVAAGGQYVTSAPSYSYQVGPDGKRYAIGGEVGIDTSMGSGDPAANLEKARTLLRAALAPAEPSTQDRRVAADARAMEIEAQRQLAELQQAESEADMADLGLDDAQAAESDGEAASDAEQAEAGVTPLGSLGGGQARLERRIGQLFAEPAEGALRAVA